jgi:hypothetical protein
VSKKSAVASFLLKLVSHNQRAFRAKAVTDIFCGSLNIERDGERRDRQKER